MVSLNPPTISDLWADAGWPLMQRIRRSSESPYVIGHRRIQYPVGQGFFHAGTLIFSEDIRPTVDLLFAYDCGSMPKYATARAQAIDAFLLQSGSAGGKRVIDMLYISHIHFDHVSGLEHLLRPIDGAKVDTIFLPLLTPFDSIIAFARSVADAPGAATQFYRDFTVDPVATLAVRFRPRQIVLVSRGEDGELGPGGP